MKINKNSFALRFYRIFSANSVPAASAEMSYYLLFAFFPIIMVVYASFSLVGRANPDFLSGFAMLLPTSVSQLIDSFILHISSSSSNLSFLLTGIMITLFSVTKFTRSVKAKVRNIYAVTNSSSFVTEWLISAIFSVLLLAVFYITLFVMILGEHIINLISNHFILSAFAYKLIQVLRYSITGFVVLFIILLFYYIIPNVRQKFTDVILGTVFTVIGWLLVSLIFTFYMNNFSNYSVVYGSLGAFIILLLWFYMMSMLLLAGAVINSMVYNGKRNIKIGYTQK